MGMIDWGEVYKPKPKGRVDDGAPITVPKADKEAG